MKNESVTNIAEANVPASEVALQDHSVGSTTNFPSFQVDLNTGAESSVLIDSSCQDVINNMNHANDIVCESEEVIFESKILFSVYGLDFFLFIYSLLFLFLFIYF